MDALFRLVPPRRAPLIVLAAALTTILCALFFEHALGYVPCALCLEQRWPYYIAIPAAALAWIVSREANLGLWPEWLMGAISVVWLVSAGLALRHMGVEWGWWEGPAGCGGGAAFTGSIDDLDAALSAARVVPCDEPAWTFLGLSLAGYNLLISLGLAAVSFVPLLAGWKEKHTP